MVNTLHNWQREFELSRNWNRRTRRKDFAVLDRIINFLGPDVNPRHVFQTNVKAYRDWRQRNGIKATTIRREIGVGRRFYKFLIDKEIIERFFNPFEGIQTKEEIKKPTEINQ